MRTILVLLVATATLVAGTFLGLGSSGRTQEPAATIQVYEGVTHVAYLGPTLPVAQALNNSTRNVTAVWFFDRFDQALPWKLWSAALPNGLQGFTDLTFGEAYFTISSLTFNWNYAAGVVPDAATGVELVAGGNSVVYLGPTQGVEEALSALAPGTTPGLLTVDVIWRFDPGQNADQPWSLWSPTIPAALRGFDQLSFGEAYYIVAATPGTLSFIAPPPPAAQELAIVENYAATAFFPGRFVVRKGQPVRIYFSRLHREHINP